MASTFKNALKSGVGTTPVVCYTTPVSTTTTVIGLSIANTHNATIYVDVDVTDTSAGVTAKAGKQLLVPVRGSIIVIGGDQKLVLEAGDIVTITSSTANSADVIMSVLEVA
jgi:mannose-6-phosphate isomerase class I